MAVAMRDGAKKPALPKMPGMVGPAWTARDDDRFNYSSGFAAAANVIEHLRSCSPLNWLWQQLRA